MANEEIDNSLRTAMGWMVRRQIEKQIEFMNSPLYQRWLEKSRAEWRSRPWYQRAWIRTKSKVRTWRERAGEIVGGRRFDND